MKTLHEALPRLTGPAMLLVTVPEDATAAANADTLRSLALQGFQGVYASITSDYLTVSSALDEAGVDLKKLKFVDAASRMFGIGPASSPDVLYVDGPLAMDSILDGIRKLVAAIPGARKFVLLDSLSTLLLYNSLDEVVAFRDRFRDLLKQEKCAGIVVVAYRDALDPQLTDRLAQGENVELVAA